MPLAPWIAVLYGLGVVLMLARLAAGVWQANRLGHRGQILREGPLVELVQTMAAKWSMSVVPVLVRVDEIFVPKMVGLVWPKILLPASALTGLSAPELEMILMHELAHVRRHDMWVSLLQRLAEAVLFFNPAAWYLTRRIGTLRECCCDEMACRSMAPDARSRAEYVLALLRVAELARDSMQQAGNRRAIEQQELVALSASGRSPSQLRLRLASLFGEPVREPLRLSAGGMLTVMALALALLFGPVSWRSAANSATSDTKQPAEQPVGAKSVKSAATSEANTAQNKTADRPPKRVSLRSMCRGGCSTRTANGSPARRFTLLHRAWTGNALARRRPTPPVAISSEMHGCRSRPDTNSGLPRARF